MIECDSPVSPMVVKHAYSGNIKHASGSLCQSIKFNWNIPASILPLPSSSNIANKSRISFICWSVNRDTATGVVLPLIVLPACAFVAFARAFGMFASSPTSQFPRCSPSRNPSLLNCDHCLGKSLGIRRKWNFCTKKGVFGRAPPSWARVGKWALVMTSCLYARWMQMAESRRGCTPAQQSMCSSN